MTPLEWLIALAIIWWMARAVLSDVRSSLRGQGARRWREGKARAAADGRRYGLRSYLADCWVDGWTVARAKRQARVEQRLEHIRQHGPGPTWRRRAADRWGTAWNRWEARMSQRWQQRQARDGRPAAEPVAPVSPAAGGDRPDLDQPGQAAGQRGDQEQQAEKREPVEPVIVGPWHPERDRPEAQELTARPGPGGRWIVDDPEQAGESKQERGKGEHMSEVTGLASALAHATEMRQAFEESAAGAETYLAGLQAGGVTGESLASVQQAMEAQQQAAAAWARTEATLARHMQVKEAYDSNADAGSKEFVTSE